MKVAIIEDEPLAARRLEQILTAIDDKIEVIAQLDTISSAIPFFRLQEPLDLLLMDVELADGVCFEIFQHVTVNVPIIFTTAYDHYAIRAFDLNSIHYLLKPIRQTDLEKALVKFSTMEKTAMVDMLAVRELLQNGREPYKNRFLGRMGNKLVHKSADSIAYFYSEEKMVFMVDREKRRYLVDTSLEDLESKWLDPNQFFRVSRKFIVNINMVDLMKKYHNQRLQLFLDIQQEHEIIVSRERVADFKNWLNK